MNQKFEIIENIRVAKRTMRMQLRGDTTGFTSPGQFVNIQVPEKYLRRPISVADWQRGIEGTLTLLYDVVGSGTSIMSEMGAGDKLELLTPLGNGFDVNASGQHPVLLGGGIGVAPLLALAKALQAAGKNPLCLLGFNSVADIILQEELSSQGIETHIATADGSYGYSGFVTGLYDHVLEERKEKGIPTPDYFYACGPNPMLKAICGKLDIPGEISLDERMGCGFGACLGCTVKTVNGPRRCCTEGPVFKKEEVIWE